MMKFWQHRLLHIPFTDICYIIQQHSQRTTSLELTQASEHAGDHSTWCQNHCKWHHTTTTTVTLLRTQLWNGRGSIT